MDAKPVLVAVARALREQRLEAILIGNAAAALHGATVTTIDLDFFIPKTAGNLKKLERVADSMRAVVFTPHYPVSAMFRLSRDTDALQLDFMTQIHGVRSFNSLRSRAVEVEIEGERISVASQADIIASKRAADRPRDRAVLHALEKTLSEEETRAEVLEALKLESEAALLDQIRRLRAKPMSERTHFLRKRIGLRGSTI